MPISPYLGTQSDDYMTQGRCCSDRMSGLKSSLRGSSVCVSWSPMPISKDVNLETVWLCLRSQHFLWHLHCASLSSRSDDVKPEEIALVCGPRGDVAAAAKGSKYSRTRYGSWGLWGHGVNWNFQKDPYCLGYGWVCEVNAWGRLGLSLSWRLRWGGFYSNLNDLESLKLS